MKAVGVDNGIIAIENNKPDAIDAIKKRPVPMKIILR